MSKQPIKHLTIEGNLADDPRLAYVPKKDNQDEADPVVSMRVLHTTRVPDGNGGWTDGVTRGVEVELWGPQALVIAESINKGDAVQAECYDFWTEAWIHEGKAYAKLKARAANILLSMRFHPARSQRERKSAA